MIQSNLLTALTDMACSSNFHDLLQHALAQCPLEVRDEAAGRQEHVAGQNHAPAGLPSLSMMEVLDTQECQTSQTETDDIQYSNVGRRGCKPPRPLRPEVQPEIDSQHQEMNHSLIMKEIKELQRRCTEAEQRCQEAEAKYQELSDRITKSTKLMKEVIQHDETIQAEETKRNAQEQQRQEREQKREEAEKQRADGEQKRKAAEKARVEAERERRIAERERERAEMERREAELDAEIIEISNSLSSGDFDRTCLEYNRVLDLECDDEDSKEEEEVHNAEYDGDGGSSSSSDDDESFEQLSKSCDSMLSVRLRAKRRKT